MVRGIEVCLCTMILTVTAVQWSLLQSRSMETCMHETRELYSEGRWMRALALAQFLSVVALLTWLLLQCCLRESEPSEILGNNQDETKADQQ